MSALALSPAAQAARPPVPSGSSPRRDAMTVEGTPSGEVGKIVIFSGIQAMAQARRYGTNAALWTSVRGIGCDDARRFLATGVDQCGRIHGQSTFPNPNPVICARGVRSRHGDSGGPVYTRPDSRGRVRAVGVLVRSSVGGLNRDLCYTPIQAVLAAYGAELPTGAVAVPPPPPPPPGS